MEIELKNLIDIPEIELLETDNYPGSITEEPESCPGNRTIRTC